MDSTRFDSLTRSLARRLPRRGLGPLGIGLLQVLGGWSGAEAKRPDGKDHDGHHRKRGKRPDEGHRDGRDGMDKRQDHADEDAAAEKKKKAKCVTAGGSCKKPKKGKGKARKCCAGLSCDKKSNRCVAPQSACPSEMTSCDGGCVPLGTPCCAGGQRPCDGACVSGPGACEAEFANCMAPVTAEWYEAVEACADACADVESAACRSCIDGVLEEFIDPLSHCLLQTSVGLDGERRAERAEVEAEDTLRTCNIFERRLCRLNSIVSDSGQAAYGTLVGALDGPIGALAGFLANYGQLYVDWLECERQYGCPDGVCDSVHEVCCDSGNCKYYDPNTKSCSISCAKDSYCDPISQTCQPNCKGCDGYLVDGRQMPCGKITNNCGKTLTCNGCPNGQVCENRRCVDRCSRGRKRSGRAGDECCEPQTCEELGRECGSWDDGCGETLHCGSCSDGETCTDQGTCEALDPCEVNDCRWMGTFRQRWTFHGTGVHNEVTTLDTLKDVTYDIHADNLATITSTQSFQWRTDDPNICEHLVQSGGWELAGHTEEHVYMGGAISCGAPGSGGSCSFNFSGTGQYITVQECTTCSSGTCCTPGCHDVQTESAPGARPAAIGTPTGATLSGSDTMSEDGCSWGFCGTSNYERTWNLTYGPIA